MLNVILFSEKGLLKELWDYVIDKYFSPDIPPLENFSLGTGSLVSLQIIIIGLSVGIIIALFSTIFNKRYVGDFIRKLIYEDCFDANRAKTLYELGYHRSPSIRGMIKSGGTLSRWVRCVEEDEFLTVVNKKRAEFDELHKNEPRPPRFKEPEFKRDPGTMHFYLPEEKKYAAEVKFDKIGTNFGVAILMTVFAIVLCSFLCYILPDMLQFLDNFIGVMK